jgi:hypothetical protein
VVAEPFSVLVERQLAVYLGPHTARSAVKTFSQRALGKTPDQLTTRDASALLDALRPMLRTLLGSDESEMVVQRILGEVGR